MPGFITDPELKSSLQDSAQRISLDNVGDTLITRANQRAWSIIVRSLARRGYSQAQLAAWDDGVELQTDLGIWFVVSELSKNAPDAYKEQSLDKFDRRAELWSPKDHDEELPILCGGILQTPAGPLGPVQTTPGLAQPGQLVGGPEDTTEDQFAYPDPCDSRIGHYPRF